MDTPCKYKKPLFDPYFLAGRMLSAERPIIQVAWKRGMVSEKLSCCCNGFFGSCNEHIEFEVQVVLAILSIVLKGSSKKYSNGVLDPVGETILTGKTKAVGRVKVSFEQFGTSKLDALYYLPHVRYMENIDKLSGAFSLEWCPGTTYRNQNCISIK